jgi:uncharacterized membrane protein
VLDNLNPTSDDFLQNDFSTLVYGVSKALILNPFAAAFALVALIPSIVTVFTTWRFTQILTTIFLTIAMLCSWVSFIINIVFAALVRSRIKSATNGAYKGAIGNAVWISLAGAIIMTIATLMALIGSVCCVKRRKEPEEAPLHPEHEVGPVDSHEFAGEKNHHGLETEQPAPKKSFKFWGKKQQQPVVATTV